MRKAYLYFISHINISQISYLILISQVLLLIYRSQGRSQGAVSHILSYKQAFSYLISYLISSVRRAKSFIYLRSTNLSVSLITSFKYLASSYISYIYSKIGPLSSYLLILICSKYLISHISYHTFILFSLVSHVLSQASHMCVCVFQILNICNGRYPLLYTKKAGF